MAVRRLDTSDLSEELHGLMALCHAEVNAEEPYRSRADTEAYLRNPPDSEARHYWIAEAAGACVGFAQLRVVRGASRGRTELLVHPDHRRTGHGRALLEAVQEQAKRIGARTLVGAHATEAGSRFARAAGAIESYRTVHSLLRLPLGEEVGSRPADDYTLRSWIGAAPSELLDSYARAREAINDAPDGYDEREVWTPELVRDFEAAIARRDQDIRVTIALDPHGEVVAFTELRVSRAEGSTAGTEDTAVVASHRRRGLARWVKVESLRLLQRDRPDVSLVTTSNAEDNHAMLALNRALGFSPLVVWTISLLEASG
jgi:mycothiol synthase